MLLKCSFSCVQFPICTLKWGGGGGGWNGGTLISDIWFFRMWYLKSDSDFFKPDIWYLIFLGLISDTCIWYTSRPLPPPPPLKCRFDGLPVLQCASIIGLMVVYMVYSVYVLHVARMRPYTCITCITWLQCWCFHVMTWPILPRKGTSRQADPGSWY